MPPVDWSRVKKVNPLLLLLIILIIFIFLIILIGLLCGYVTMGKSSSNPGSVVILELKGSIGRGRYLSFETSKKKIDQAFGVENLQAVLLEISSGGGSAHETERIADYLKAKMTRTKTPVVSFVLDYALSGGYWLACSGMEIYVAGRMSEVGSIGVIIQYYNYDKFWEMLGVEKKTITAGKMKGLRNSKEGEERLQAIVFEIHQIFIETVEASRGDRLRVEDKDIFNGNYWLTDGALKLGLIDGIQTSADYIEQNFPNDTKIFRI